MLAKMFVFSFITRGSHIEVSTSKIS